MGIAENERISVSTVREKRTMLFQVNSERVFVDSLGSFHGAQIFQAVSAVLRIQCVVDGELDVVGRQLRAVVKLDAAAQFKGVNFSVFGNFPGFGEPRLNCALSSLWPATART